MPPPGPRTAGLALLALVALLAGCASPGPGALSVQLVSVPATASAGSTVEVTYRYSGDAAGVAHSDIHYGDRMPDPGVPSETAEGQLQSGGTYRASLVAAEAGTLFVRAHVIAEGRDLWSDEARVAVQPAP